MTSSFGDNLVDETEQRILGEFAHLKTISGDDVESDHQIADGLLCEMLIVLGYGEIVDAWQQIHKWYA